MSFPPAIHRVSRRQGAAPRRTVVIVLVAVAAAVLAQDVSRGNRRRGQFLRAEVVRTETEETYSCSLAPTSGSYPALLFRRQEQIRQHEARIYEAVVEERVTDAETGRDGITYRVLPGEEVRGEMTTRESSRDLGAFADASFEVNGIPIRTDRGGLHVDREQRLLAPFDDLSVNVIELAIRHSELGALTSRITRYLTLRWQDKRPQERLQLVQTDVLVALGADFEPVTAAGSDGLRLTAALPESLLPGQQVVVRVEARNDGSRPVACLLARVFGRHSWLSDLNFYLGNLPPGGQREFERLVQVPDNAPPGPVYAVVGFWDIRGALKQAAQPLACTIASPPPAPAGPPAAVAAPE